MAVITNLSDRTYSAADVAHAAGCSEHALTNYISKNRLELCSEAPGQGRRREFPIIDVFQVALMTAVVGLCHNAPQSALVCNGELFVGINLLVINTNERFGRNPTASEIGREYERLAVEYRNNLRAAPKPFFELDAEKPWILFFEFYNDGRLPRTEWLNWSNPLNFSTPDLVKGYYLNATHTFSTALERLDERHRDNT